MGLGPAPENGARPAGQSGEGSPGLTTPPTSRRRLYTLAGVITAVIVATLVALYGAGLFTGGAAGGAAGPDTLNGALGAATGVLASVPGGPWHLTSAVGVAYTVPWSLDGSLLAHECSIISGTWDNATYHAGSGNYSGGEAGIWVLSFSGPTTTSGILWVLVGYGVVAQFAVVAVSGTCSEYSGPSLGTVIDSSVAMEKVLATANGSRFAGMFPQANVTYALGPGSPPVWTIHFSPCGAFVAGPESVSSSVWALNGTVQDPPHAPVAC